MLFFALRLQQLFAGGRVPSEQEVFRFLTLEDPAFRGIQVGRANLGRPLAALGLPEILRQEEELFPLPRIERELAELKTEVERVAELARQTLQVGSGLLGRSIEGMSARQRLVVLEEEIGLLVGEREAFVESLG